MCVPESQVKKAMKQVSQAKRMEYGLKGEFSSKLVDVRQGTIDESELWALAELFWRSFPDNASSFFRRIYKFRNCYS